MVDTVTGEGPARDARHDGGSRGRERVADSRERTKSHGGGATWPGVLHGTGAGTGGTVTRPGAGEDCGTLTPPVKSALAGGIFAGKTKSTASASGLVLHPALNRNTSAS